MALPCRRRLVALVNTNLHSREYVRNAYEKRHHDILDKERLCVLYHGGLPIAEEGNGHVHGFFKVSLCEKFLKKKVSPLLNCLKRTESYRHVTSMNHSVKQNLL